MPILFYRETELVNETIHPIEIREIRRFAPAGHYEQTINLGPFCSLDIPATKFNNRSIEAGRPTVLKIFKNGEDTGELLSPNDFIHFARLVFRVEPDSGRLIVRGIPARVTDFGRLRGLGWLFGRNLEGREDERII